MLRTQTACGDPDTAATSGLVAYLDDEPVGWVAVEPRTAYPKLRTSRVPWSGRHEDKDDHGVWAVTCLVVRKGYRGRGLTYALAQATIDFARGRGASCTSGPVRSSRTPASRRSAPTVRRVVMRIDFEQEGGLA
ncbi:MAG: GNAT family N-acetyltransferase [Micromonosporaceae bacterium]